MALAAQLDAAERMSRPPVVLVVEDEALVRMVAAEFLRDAGYSVLEAEDAREALAVFESGAPVDAVFSDVQMPGPMDGLMLAAWVREHHRTPVLLTSGGRDLARIASQFGTGAFLPKPYALQEILRRLETLMDEAAASRASLRR
jgi:CheY-like chemotaxis protein